MSRLTISSKTAVNPCGFKASYADGKLTKDGIKPCAMPDKGTQINVEDLFYNSSIRRNALRNGTEEFSKIYDVVARYAIHNYHVSFFLKRAGENSMDLKTNGCLAATGKGKCLENETFLQENIGIIKISKKITDNNQKTKFNFVFFDKLEYFTKYKYQSIFLNKNVVQYILQKCIFYKKISF